MLGESENEKAERKENFLVTILDQKKNSNYEMSNCSKRAYWWDYKKDFLVKLCKSRIEPEKGQSFSLQEAGMRQ
jgi:hypothetical protein